jgi:hypothetical protein
MSDRSRVAAPTHRHQPPGLRLVPFGLVFVAVGLWHDGQLYWLPGADNRGVQVWMLAALAVAVLAANALGRFYCRLFGGHSSGSCRTIIGLCISTVAMIGTLLLQDVIRWPLALPVAVTGVILAYVGLVQDRERTHYVAVAIGWLIMANIDAYGVPMRTQQVMFDLLVAGSLITAGVGDHRLLLRLSRSRAPNQSERGGVAPNDRICRSLPNRASAIRNPVRTLPSAAPTPDPAGRS